MVPWPTSHADVRELLSVLCISDADWRVARNASITAAQLSPYPKPIGKHGEFAQG